MTKKSGFLSRLKKAFTRSRKKAVDVSDQLIGDLEEQIRSNPGNFRLRLKLADLYQVRGEHEKALEEYLKSARLYQENDFIPLAIATYKKILNEESDHLEANLELARIYRQKKFFADAVIHYLKVFEYFQENGQTSKALEILETIISIAPEKEPYRLMLKELFPDYQESAKSIYSDIIVTREKAPGKNPPPLADNDAGEDSFFDLGAELGSDILIDENSIAPAVMENTETDAPGHGIEEIFQTMKSTVQEDSDSDQDKFRYNLALAYYELDMPDQALKESEGALESANFRLPALLLRSRIYFAMGSLSAALSQVQQGLLEKGLTRQDFLTLKMQLGLILKEMGHKAQALEAFHEAYALEPENQELLQEIRGLEDAETIIQ